MYMNIRILRDLKEELVWAIDEQLRLINNKMLFKIILPLKTKNKPIMDLKQHCMHCYVTPSNILIITSDQIK